MDEKLTGRQLFELMRAGIAPPRIPFVPTIYEHAAQLINRTPTQIAQSEELLVEAQLTAYALYQHDLVSVGVDIYNVECEALGAVIEYHDDDSMPSLTAPIMSSPADTRHLSVPDPTQAGRMPLFISACRSIAAQIGDEVPVNGTITGPFTLAALLRGFEDFVLDLLTEPVFAAELLDFCVQVSARYASAFLRHGVPVAINESWIAPPLISPTMYGSRIMGYDQKLIRMIQAAGQQSVPLICGGQTGPILPSILQTGTSLVLADAESDYRYFRRLCEAKQVFLRASIASKLVEQGSMTEVHAAVEALVTECASYSRFLFGCGIVSYATKPKQLLAVKHLIEELTPETNINA